MLWDQIEKCNTHNLGSEIPSSSCKSEIDHLASPAGSLNVARLKSRRGGRLSSRSISEGAQ